MTSPGAFFTFADALPFAGRRVLLTGASGFIGGHVARQGLAAGVEVHVLTRSGVPAGCKAHRADLADRESVRAVVQLSQPDLIIHLASPGVAFGTAEFDEMLAIATTGTEALLSAAVELASKPHVLHIGSGLEFSPQDRPTREDDPLVPSASRYGAAKAASSAALGGFAGMLPITLLRPFNVYGAGDTAPRLGSLIIDRARRGEPMDVTRGEQMRDFLHVDDCGRAIWQAAALNLDGPMRILNVGSGEPRPLRDYIASIADALATAGFPIDIRYGAQPYRSGEPMISIPDLARLHTTMDWRPLVPFAAGIADYVEWSLARWNSDAGA